MDQQMNYLNVFYNINPIRAFIYSGLILIVIKTLLNVINNNLKYSNLPQPPLSPILGTLFGHIEHYFYSKNKKKPLQFFGRFVYEYAAQLQKRGEGLFRLKFGPFHNVVLIINGETAEKVLNQRCINKPSEYGLLSPLLGKGLVMTNGSEWKAARRALVPAFNQANLNRILPITNDQAAILCKIIDDNLDENGQFEISDLKPLCINFSIDNILESSMGINLNAQLNWKEKYFKNKEKDRTPEEEYHHNLERAFEIILQRILNPWYKVDWIFNLSSTGRRFRENVKIVREFTKKVILERKLQLEKNNNLNDENVQKNNNLMPVLDLMLKYNSEDSTVFDVDAICDQVTTLVFAGHDTTSTTANFFFTKIATLPNVQAKLHEEIDAIFNGDIQRSITPEDIKRMPYLEACIKECLRMAPPIALYGRHIEDDTQCGKYTIPRDATVIVASPMLLRDPLAFEKPNNFIPERFLESNSYKFHHGAYLPFGTGPRVCIGFTYAMQALKVVITQILRRYRLETTVNVNKLLFSYTINTKISSNVPMKFIKRHSLSVEKVE